MSDEIVPKTKFTEYRQKAGLTQLGMSQLLGVTENTYANWEKGRSGLRWIEMVVKLCKLFDCETKGVKEHEQD
jgi:DNA-binding XRE family transcriptional regulator